MLKDKHTFLSVGQAPTNNIEPCLLGDIVKLDADYDRHERIRNYSELWVNENIEPRIAETPYEISH